ncbi:MAG: hypothetical protein MUC49_07850 [Raineya sp.]|nr:hypothetical protein [Raineya sp.]
MFVILTGAILLASCEKSRPVTYTGGNFVHFQDSLLNISESSAKEDANGSVQKIPSIATIRINRATTDISKDLVVSFSLTAKYVKIDTVTGSPTNGEEIEVGDVPQGRFYLSSPSNITIKAGEAFAFLTVTSVDNDDVDGNKKLMLSLESTSDASFGLGYPGPDKKNKSAVLYIVDDDCPYDRDKFLGNVEITDSDAFGTGVSTYSTVIVTVPASVVNFEVKDFFKYSRINPAFPQVSAFVSVNTATKACLFVDQPFTGTGLNATLRIVSDTPGTLNNCDGTFTIPFRIYSSANPNIVSDEAIVVKP